MVKKFPFSNNDFDACADIRGIGLDLNIAHGINNPNLKMMVDEIVKGLKGKSYNL